MNEEEQEKKKLECEKCGSAFVYVRIKDKQIVCRKCGHVSELKEDDEKKGE